MKPKKLYKDWYKDLKFKLNVQKTYPNRFYLFDKTFKAKDSTISKRNNNKYSKLVQVLMKDVNVSINKYVEGMQYSNVHHRTTLHDFTGTILINNVPCKIITTGRKNPSTSIVLHAPVHNNYINCIVIRPILKFSSGTNTYVQQVNDVNFENYNPTSEEDMFRLSTVINDPELYTKAYYLMKEINKYQNLTIHNLFTILKNYKGSL